MTLHESSQQLNAQGLKFDADNNHTNNPNMMQQPAYQSFPQNVQYPINSYATAQQCVPQNIPQHDISQQYYVAQNMPQQYPPQQYLPQQDPQYITQQSIPQQFVPPHIPQHDVPPQDILQHIPQIIPVQQNILPPQDIAPQNVNIPVQQNLLPPQDILQQFIPPVQQNITLQENFPPQNISLQNIPQRSISPQHIQQDISPQHIQQNISPGHIHQSSSPQNLHNDITLGNRNMTIKCNVQRRGSNYYHSVVDASGKELYELVNVNKSLVLQNQAKDDAVSTRSKFPHRKFALDILAEDGPHMAEYSTKIRHHKVSVTVDDVVYCRLKSSTSHGHEKRREWAAAGTLTPVALQVGKHDLTFYPNCSDAVEKAILFAVCHKCLHHDNS